jgi:hypothetical protein
MSAGSSTESRVRVQRKNTTSFYEDYRMHLILTGDIGE